MTTLTRLNRRDKLGFLNRRVVKLRPPSISARMLIIGMVTCWLVAGALAAALVVSSLS